MDFAYKYNIPKLAIPTENATLNLLKSSTLVSFSGALRIYIAAILLQTHVDILTILAGWLIIYSVYTLDRTLDSEEDLINRTEEQGACKKVGFAVTLFTFIVGAWIYAKNGLLALAFLPFVTGYLYSKGIRIGKFSLRLKGGLGVKNIIVGLAWGIFIAGTAGVNCQRLLPVFVVFIMYGVKVFINSAIDDFKDIKGDTLAGIRTLPVCMGELKTRNILLGMHLLSHLVLGVALIEGWLTFEPLIILCSFLCGLICIWRYTSEERYMSRKVEMEFFKDGEALLIIILRGIAGIPFL